MATPTSNTAHNSPGENSAGQATEVLDGQTKPLPAKSERSGSEAAVTKSAPKSEEGDLPVGSMLGSYRIERLLGRGGMGAVYLAVHDKLERKYALKTMSGQLASKDKFVGRFYREARSMAKIEHPNVVKCYDVAESDGVHYVVMELVDGQSMQDWMKTLGRLSVSDAVLVTLQCALALEHAHEKNLIHRDIKPDNILVTNRGEIKVSDLGLAKSLDDEEMSLTQSGTGLGTPYYMAPEQARNAKHVDGRSDIYALGCTLYHFLTGGYPFKADSTVELLMEKEKGTFKRSSSINKEVPERLDLIIDKAMAKKPEHRYSSCSELIRDLSALGLAGTSLSFIKAPNRHTMAPINSVSATSATKTSIPNQATREMARPSATTTSTQSRTQSVGTAGVFYIRHINSQGKPVVTKSTTEKILAALASGKLDLKAQATRDPKLPFAALGQFREFQEVVQKKAAAAAADQRGRQLGQTYQKIDKQYRWQKVWRKISQLQQGVLGWFGLVIYLGIVAGLIYGGWLLWPSVYEILSGWAAGFGLKAAS